MVWNWLRRHPYLIDGTLVVVLLAILIARDVHLHRTGVGVALALWQVLPLLGRRRWSSTVLVAVSAACVTDAIVFGALIPLAPAVGVYTVASHLERRRALDVAAPVATVLLAVSWAVNGYHNAILLGALLVAGWVIGDNLGTRRAYTRELELKAARLERERETEAARAVAEEQARIARELHDVVAHNLSVMVVQAAAANDVFETRPERARDALEAIESTGRAALGELRRLLGTVRSDGVEYAPQPGLDRLDELVGQVRAAGLEVALRVEGEPRPLPAALDLSAYRVVQEALTNTLKHARASHAEVALRYRDEDLAVEVRDDGAGDGEGGGAGQGLIGMRERVGVFGGSLEAGPVPGGGFAVSARFPLGAPA